MHYTMLMQWFRFEMKIILVRKRDGGREIELNDKIAHRKNELCKKQQTFFCVGVSNSSNLETFFLSNRSLDGLKCIPHSWHPCNSRCPFRELFCLLVVSVLPSTKAHKLLYRNEMTMNNKEKTQLNSTAKNENWKIWRMNRIAQRKRNNQQKCLWEKKPSAHAHGNGNKKAHTSIGTKWNEVKWKNAAEKKIDGIAWIKCETNEFVMYGWTCIACTWKKKLWNLPNKQATTKMKQSSDENMPCQATNEGKTAENYEGKNSEWKGLKTTTAN